MSRNTLLIGLILLVVVLGGGGFWLYNTVLGETEAASGPITAVPLDLSSAPTSAPEPTAAAASAPLRYQIVQSGSQVRFQLDELLNGSPFTVVGSTDQVAGELALASDDLGGAQIGVITINARTLATDSDRRDRAIRNVVLSTDSYEFITFTPTAINGLSGSGEPGQSYSFEIVGDLTIRDVTLPVVFTAQVTAESAERLIGSATTTINRNDYGLVIPDVPFVANVSEDVILTIDFVAEAV
ncbi:MAG: YceI family protein [Oscillochloris sp.]|nr:YceI family protein [Oscillochloris sp.]